MNCYWVFCVAERPVWCLCPLRHFHTVSAEKHQYRLNVMKIPGAISQDCNTVLGTLRGTLGAEHLNSLFSLCSPSARGMRLWTNPILSALPYETMGGATVCQTELSQQLCRTTCSAPNGGLTRSRSGSERVFSRFRWTSRLHIHTML